jgi:hypothetical protein
MIGEGVLPSENEAIVQHFEIGPAVFMHLPFSVLRL